MPIPTPGLPREIPKYERTALLQKTSKDRPSELRLYQSRAHRGIYRPGRLQGATQGAHGHDPGSRSSPRSRPRACGAGAAPGSPPGSNGNSAGKPPGTSNMSSATPMRATPEPLWTGILEGDPHAVLEGMAIGAYAIGANEGYIYCRAEYPLAIKRLKIAIAQAEEMGLLGDHIFGTDFLFQTEDPGRRRGLCLRRRNGPDRLHRRQGGRTPAPSALPGPERPVGQARPLSTMSRPGPTSPLSWPGGPIGTSKYGTEAGQAPPSFALVGKVNNTGPGGNPLGDHS